MFQVLQRNSSFNYVLLPIVALLLWGMNIIEPHFVTHYYDSTPMVLYKPLMAIQNATELGGQLVGILIVCLNIIALVKVNSSIRLIEKRSVFYILLYIIFSASLQDFKQLNPMQPALLFLILGFASLFKMYKQERELTSIFEAGVCVAIATLFYAPSIYFAVVVFIGLLVLVPFYWRQWLAALFGILLPIFIVFAISFCFDTLQTQIQVWNVNLFTQRAITFNSLTPLIFSLFLALLFILSSVYAFSGGLKKVVLRKCYFILLLFLALILSVYLFVPYVGIEFLFFGTLPVAIYIANYMVNIRSKIFAEALFFLIIACTVCVQIFPDITINL